jgi:hypothetical protein
MKACRACPREKEGKKKQRADFFRHMKIEIKYTKHLKMAM